MPEEGSGEESSLSSDDDDDAESLAEVVMHARREVSDKECQRRFANKFINLFRSVASMREVDGTSVVYKERYDLTQARELLGMATLLYTRRSERSWARRSDIRGEVFAVTP